MKEYEAYKAFDEFLDECYPKVNICGYMYQVSRTFKELDPIAYNEEFYNWCYIEGIEVE